MYRDLSSILDATVTYLPIVWRMAGPCPAFLARYKRRTYLVFHQREPSRCVFTPRRLAVRRRSTRISLNTGSTRGSSYPFSHRDRLPAKDVVANLGGATPSRLRSTVRPSSGQDQAYVRKGFGPAVRYALTTAPCGYLVASPR